MSENNSQDNSSRRTTPGQVFSFSSGLVQVPRETGIKRCGYCDMLVRWTSQGGSNIAVNSDGSRHMCLTDGSAKRRDPIKQDRPTPAEVSTFLKVGSAAGPVTGAGGNVQAQAQAQAVASQEALPDQQHAHATAIQPAPATVTPAPAAQGHNAAMVAIHEASVAALALKAQAEATDRLADAMIEVARSVDALAKASGDITTSNYRLADEVARLTHLLRGIVAAATARKEGVTAA